MNNRIRLVATSLALCLAGGISSVSAEQLISIGTGGITGVYDPAGGAICRVVNESSEETGIRCSAESTGGSIHNINTIRAGGFEFGVVQSDLQYHAYHGTSKFADKGQFEGLRAVFSLHAEAITIIARDDSDIDNVTDFKGKRINIGNPGSGQRGTWELMEGALGWSRSDLSVALELESAETGQAVCDNKIDAYFWAVGHPNALTQESLAICSSHLVSATGSAIDKLIVDNPYYRYATIPAGMYNNNEDIDTFGVSATLVTSTEVAEEVVYTIVKAVFESLDQFKKLHPALAHLKESEMITVALSAPLHDGAVKYYKERGWM